MNPDRVFHRNPECRIFKLKLTMDASLTSLIKDLELELLRPDVRSNAARVSLLLADDFMEFGESGKSYTKADVLASLPGTGDTSYTINDFTVHELSSDIALATYLAQKESPGRKTSSLRSSLWQKRDGRWQMVFHQGTPQHNSAGGGRT